MTKVIIFYRDKEGKMGQWVVDADRMDHILKVMQARGFIITGSEKIV